MWFKQIQWLLGMYRELQYGILKVDLGNAITVEPALKTTLLFRSLETSH